MPVKVAINGYGRIGRNILRALYEGEHRGEITDRRRERPRRRENQRAFDALRHRARAGSDSPSRSRAIRSSSTATRSRSAPSAIPSKLPWKALGVDIVLECTGLFTSKEKAGAHLKAGARKVIISAPGEKDVDATVVYGVNDKTLKASHTVISNASCTTNCLAPIAKVLHDSIGIVRGLMTTVHSYTNDQVLTDVFHKDLRRARSATHVDDPDQDRRRGRGRPRAAGAQRQARRLRDPRADDQRVGRRPHVRGRARDDARKRSTTPMKKAAAGALKGILEFNDGPLVSVDFNHNPASSIYDSTLTKVIDGKLVKICSWYDNEWGFSNRMLDTTLAFAAL